MVMTQKKEYDYMLLGHDFFTKTDYATGGKQPRCQIKDVYGSDYTQTMLWYQKTTPQTF